MKNFYRIKITQTASLLDYCPSAHFINLGFFRKPKKEVDKYASLIRRVLGDGVKVEVIRHNFNFV